MPKVKTTPKADSKLTLSNGFVIERKERLSYTFLVTHGYEPGADKARLLIQAELSIDKITPALDLLKPHDHSFIGSIYTSKEELEKIKAFINQGAAA